MQHTLSLSLTLTLTLTPTPTLTLTKVLLSIEMPQQRQKNFILRSPMPTLKNPIKVGPGGTHTQGIKFVTKRHELGVFRHTLLLNFSNFIYEHVLVVNVSTPKAAADLQP